MLNASPVRLWSRLVLPTEAQYELVRRKRALNLEREVLAKVHASEPPAAAEEREITRQLGERVADEHVVRLCERLSTGRFERLFPISASGSRPYELDVVMRVSAERRTWVLVLEAKGGFNADNAGRLGSALTPWGRAMQGSAAYVEQKAVEMAASRRAEQRQVGELLLATPAAQIRSYLCSAQFLRTSIRDYRKTHSAEIARRLELGSSPLPPRRQRPSSEKPWELFLAVDRIRLRGMETIHPF